MRFLEFGVKWLPVFIIVHWLCDLIWLSLVSVTVYRTHSLWGPKRLWGRTLQEWLFVACSLLLVGFGIWFLISGLQLVV